MTPPTASSTDLPAANAAVAPVEDAQIAALHAGLLGWYAANRRDLPWRQTRDPYRILLAEMMLQQTQVPRVLPRWHAWLERFPTLEALAAAPTAAVLREWSGLGYNSRAVRLQAVARHVVAEYAGVMPRDVPTLLALPGIGEYTARAIACFAYAQDVPVLDTNVKRVLHRVLLGPDVPKPLVNDRQLWALAARTVPSGRGYDWNQGLMDFGSLICTARKPACLVCPLRPICRAAPLIGTALAEQQGARRRDGRGDTPAAVPFTGTARFFRGQILRALGAQPANEGLLLDALGMEIKPDYAVVERPWLYGLVAALHRDGLVTADPAPARPPAVREKAAPYATGDTVPAEQDEFAAVRVTLPHG